MTHKKLMCWKKKGDGWKRSQISSGYYKKVEGKLPEFIKFERTEYPFKGYMFYTR